MNAESSMRALFLLLVILVGGCATPIRGMDVFAPYSCHGPAAPFSTYHLAYVDVPGFIEPPIAAAARAALTDLGLQEVADAERSDLLVTNTFYLIDRNPPPQTADPLGEPVPTGMINRFVAHLKVDVADRRTGNLILTGSMYRSHAIAGGETFHSDRAVALIKDAYDKLLIGLKTPCR